MTREALYLNVYLDLRAIYQTACRNKWQSLETQAFDADHYMELDKLARAIVDGTYTPQPGYRFVVHEPVAREVFASHFTDRIVHHLYFAYVAPIVEKRFIRNSFSCRKGKGSLFGVQQLHRDIWSCSDQGRHDIYALKGDLSGYFMHIDRQKLCDIVCDILKKHHYKGKEARYCYRRAIAIFLTHVFALRNPILGSEKRGNPRDWDDVPARKKMEASPEGCGLPIGDLTSQLFSNIYLNVFDQWVKGTLHQRYYGRYVDDFYIISRSRTTLEALIPVIATYLKTQLGLDLNPKKCHIYKVSDKGEGVHFLGARVYLHYKLASFRVMQGYLRAHEPASINSYLGLLRHFSSEGVRLNC